MYFYKKIMSDFEKTNCLVCSSTEYLPYSKKGQFAIETNVVICKNCGFSYLNPRWTKERYHTFYTKEYDLYYRPEVMGTNYQYDPYRAIKEIISRSKAIINFETDGLTVLDIGTGMGDSLIYLKNEINKTATYFAIESSDFCVKHLEKNGITVITNDVDETWQATNKQKFDVVIMRHVLEHFLNPADVLKKVKEVLKPDGVLYVGVPNAKNPTKPLLAHFFRVVHVSYFSKLSLTNLFTLIGFSPVKVIEGDEFERKEIFAFCKKADEKEFMADKNEWLVQKNIYDGFRKKEFYYRLKDFIAKKIILRFK
jgi:2-polyprenyl-3-methyl-5-hydroxy-6-metoxy-1,4-benzoquinol methylase